MIFSKSIRVANSNLAELLALREAVIMFVASDWVNSHGLWALLFLRLWKCAEGLYPPLFTWLLQQLVCFEAVSLKQFDCSKLLSGTPSSYVVYTTQFGFRWPLSLVGFFIWKDKKVLSCWEVPSPVFISFVDGLSFGNLVLPILEVVLGRV
ncbi:hypothetical protein REPUB_Repub09cG0166800 [Reevesia pubescens]